MCLTLTLTLAIVWQHNGKMKPEYSQRALMVQARHAPDILSTSALLLLDVLDAGRLSSKLHACKCHSVRIPC